MKLSFKYYNDNFSYLINKHPDNVYGRPFENFDVIGKFGENDRGRYDVTMEPNYDKFLEYSRNMNLSNYLLNEKYMVSPLNITVIDSIFRNPLRGKFDIEYENVAHKFLFTISPIIINKKFTIKLDELIKSYIDDCNVSLLSLYENDDINIVILQINGEERIDHLLQKLYIILFAYTLKSIKDKFKPNKDQLNKLIKLTKDWINDSEYSKFLISRLGSNAFGKEYLETGEVNLTKLNNRFNNSLGNQRYKKICSMLNENSRVLDLGCSSGSLANWIIKTKTNMKSYFGIDANQMSIDTARQRNNRLRKLKFEVGNILYLDEYFFNNSNTIILTEIIEHFEARDAYNIIKFLAENCSNKRIIITVPNGDINKDYWNIDGYRHWDHKIEYSHNEFYYMIIKPFEKYNYKINKFCISDDFFFFEDQLNFAVELIGERYEY